MNPTGSYFDTGEALSGAYSDKPLDPDGAARRFLERHNATDLAEMVFGGAA